MSYIYPYISGSTTKYKLYFVQDNKKIYLGIYPSLASAQQIELEAKALMAAPRGLPSFEDYQMDYKKVIVLCNLRDHKKYIRNPIYIYPEYFHYYLSKTCILTFDLKDLFYFSTYKIRQRGQYLYIQDSISQKSILSRFGILQHSVPGKDYIFKNKNCLDFRKENLQLINPYKGVRKRQRKGELFYTCTIYHDQNLTVGHYHSEIEAAIAYNKAIDLLLAQGIHKNFIPNTIPFLTQHEYTRIYDSIVLSPYFFKKECIRRRTISSKKYRGVSQYKNSYRVHIYYKQHQYYLGSYPSEKRGAQAYNYASFYLFGNQGYINQVSPLIDNRDTEKLASFFSKYGILKGK